MSTSTQDLQERLSGLMTTQDVAHLFCVTSMTVHLWRSSRGLPALVIPGTSRPAVRFARRDVLAWAADNGRRVRLGPQAAQRLCAA